MQKRIVTRDEWLAEREQHLAMEKAFTRMRDALSAQRRALPWVRIEKEYVFEGPNGPERLEDLFDGRNQLVIYHFMFGPDWEQGCASCSFVADHFGPALIHLAHRDVTLRAVSRAPIERIEAFRKRMGWQFHWLSSASDDFNVDFRVSSPGAPLDEAPGLSVFTRGDDGAIYHTYSTYERGLDLLVGTYNLLDLVPKGRDEDGYAFSMTWLRHHDRYDGYTVDPKAGYPMPVRNAEAECCH